MSDVFNSITPDDWKRSIKTGRTRKNKVAAQIRKLVAERPLFIPLKREFFEAFERGEKTEEFRLYGARWNERTCRIGRRVTLSLGYGKARRLTGQIVTFVRDDSPLRLPGWFECYGILGAPAACIGIRLAGSASVSLSTASLPPIKTGRA